ncbi:MAG: hypothetical protein SFV54_07115 [Bryobacteraceae bacterium]|nr:hypothetical protein [Bryobacteraceae bacterium]
MSDNVCISDANTCNVVTVPLIFVPGVMGSRLHFTSIDQYWDPDSTWRMSHWLTTNVDTCASEMHYTEPAEICTAHDDLDETEIAHGWAGVYAGYHGYLRTLARDSFNNVRTPVWAVGYDWRQSNWVSANRIANRVDQILAQEEAEKCILITHSMGGLASRAAIVKCGIEANVLGVFHGVQPVRGAAVLYRRFFTGAIGSYDGGGGLAMILGNTPEKFTKMMHGLCGPMELLPTDRYHKRDGRQRWIFQMVNGVATNPEGDLYDLLLGTTAPTALPYTYLGAHQASELRARVRGSRAFHENRVGERKHPDTWAVLGTGMNTDVDTWFDPDDPNQREPFHVVIHQSTFGDQTVPARSGAALFPDGAVNSTNPGAPIDEIRQWSVDGVGHEPAYRHGTVQRIARRVIQHLLRSVV